MSRKNLANVGERDILLVWLYQNQEGVDLYAIHNVRDYNMSNNPLGTLSVGPEEGEVSIEWSAKPEV